MKKTVLIVLLSTLVGFGMAFTIDKESRKARREAKNVKVECTKDNAACCKDKKECTKEEMAKCQKDGEAKSCCKKVAE